MAIKNEELKKVYNNDYNDIIILEDKLNTDYRLIINNNSNEQNRQIQLVMNGVLDRVQTLPESQKVEEIIRYFLNNDRIVSFSDTQIIQGYLYLFNIIKGEKTSLALRLFCDKQVLSDCANKYAYDRQKFLEEEKDVTCYEMFTSESTSSYVEETYFGKKIIQLTLIKKDGKLWNKDNKFLRSWILEKLKEQDEKAKIEYHDFNNGVPVLKCGNLMIYLPDKLLQHLVRNIVNEYNKKLERPKMLQLKMEGL